MKRLRLMLVLMLAAPVAAAAQSSRFYAAAVGGADTAGPSTVKVGAVSTAGGLVGVRLTEAWSVELQVDGGFGESPERVFEGRLSSQPPGPGPHSSEAFDHYGVFGRVVSRDRAGAGYSAQVVWTTRLPGRVNTAVLAGIAGRDFTQQNVVSVTSIGPGVITPPSMNRVEKRKLTGRELMAGVMMPIRVANRVTVAPELRYKYNSGLLSDESGYGIVHLGARVMWGF